MAPVFKASLAAGRADHRRNAELARDDRRMAGSPAALGHDAGGDLHHRLPIGRGRFRDENLAGFEIRQMMRVGNDPHRTGGDLLADRAARRQHGAGGAEGIGLKSGRRPLRHHRLGPRLDDVKLPVIAILGPFDVHGHRMAGGFRIMVFDR